MPPVNPAVKKHNPLQRSSSSRGPTPSTVQPDGAHRSSSNVGAATEGSSSRPAPQGGGGAYQGGSANQHQKTGGKKPIKNIQTVLDQAQNMVQNLQKKTAEGRNNHVQPESDKHEPQLTNLERYKLQLRDQQRPAGNVLKTTVQETLGKLQQQSRMNGGAYGTNQFSSITQTDQDKGEVFNHYNNHLNNESQQETYDNDSDLSK